MCDDSGLKISELETPFLMRRKDGQASVMIRIEGDNRQICESILNQIEIVGDASKYNLVKIDRFPKEIQVFISVSNETN